jgi:hypothetical protein
LALTELKGFRGAPQRIVVERGPVRVFSEAVLDPDPAYNGDAAPDGLMTITDVYEKERPDGGKLEFYVTETDWTDAGTGELVVNSIFTMVVNCRAPK